MPISNILGKLRYNVRGEWSTLTTYAVDDIVTRVGSSYICILASNNNDPITNVNYWRPISTMPRDRGEWNSGTTYYVNDVVSVTSTNAYNQYYNWQDEDVYICITITSTNQPPASNPSSWAKISSGVFNKRLAWLGGVNEGFVPPYKTIWDAKCGASTGGVGIVSITAGGSGFTTTIGSPAGLSAATVTFSGGPGAGASAVAYVSAAGTIFNIELVNPGSNYTNPVSVTIAGGGGASATATAFSFQTRVGMGDTFGTFKGPWHHNAAGGGESWLKYINRNYGLTQYGYNYGGTGNTNGHGSANDRQYIPSEANFIHLDWYEGLLPTPDGLPPKIIQVEGGIYNTLVLFNNGEVHYSGYNGNYASGDNTTTNPGAYTRCGYARINKSGTSVLRGKKAIRIASTAGGDVNASCTNYALVENTDGARELWTWGYNGYGQTGNGNTTNNVAVPILNTFNQATNGKIVSIWATGGDYGSFYLLTDKGNMYSCGYNNYGQLGLNNTTTTSTLTLVKAWGTGTSRVKKFVVVGGSTACCCFVLQENGTLWSWGYNGYGQLGHGHTNNIYAPIQVYSGGYTGSSGANVVGTPSGTALTNVFDVWGGGPNNVTGSYIVRGTAVNSTTAFSTGYNGYYNLSTGPTDSANKSIFTAMLVNNSTALTNVVDIASNASINTAAYNGLLLKRYNGEWYSGGYNNGCAGVGHADAYNARQVQDPNYLASNQLAKNNILWPQAFDQNYIKCVQRMSNTSSGQTMWVYLKTGQLYGCNTDNQYGTLGHRSQGSHVPTRPINH
jgi:hypothetical protein